MWPGSRKISVAAALPQPEEVVPSTQGLGCLAPPPGTENSGRNTGPILSPSWKGDWERLLWAGGSVGCRQGQELPLGHEQGVSAPGEASSVRQLLEAE